MINSKPPIPKSEARKLVLERRKELTDVEILERSKKIFERLIEVEKNWLKREVLRAELKVLKLKLNKIY